MRLQTPLVYFAWRNLWRNPKRTLILLMVFTLGIGTMLFIQSIMQAWSKSMLDNALDNLTDTLQIHQPDYRQNPVIENSFLPSESLIKTLDQAGTPASPVFWAKRIRVSAMIQSEYDSLPVTLIGIQPQAEANLSFIGQAVQSGQDLIQQPKGILLGQKLVERLETQLGRRIVLMGQGFDHQLAERGLRITGVYRHSDPRVEESLVFVDYAVAEKLLALQGHTQEIALKVTSADPQALHASIQQVTDKLRQVVPKLSIQPWWELQPFIQSTNEMMDSFIWVWLGFVMLLMVFGMLNTLLMSLYERQKEFVLLHTLGMQPRRIRKLIFLEILFLVSLSIGLGLALALGFVWWGHDGINLAAYAEGAAWFGIGHQLYLTYDAEKWFEVIWVTLLVTLVFSGWPIYRATRHQALKIR